MRLLVDTNILLYSVNSDFKEHSKASTFVQELLNGSTPWSISWNIIYEFLRVSTHRKTFKQPLSHQQAWSTIETILSCKSLTILTPTENHANQLTKTLTEIHRPAGNLFHDIHTAVLLREHGVPEIITADTDFHQFKFLKVTNPVI